MDVVIPEGRDDAGFDIRVGDVISYDIAFEALPDDAMIVSCFSDGQPIEGAVVRSKANSTWPSCLPALLVHIPGEPYRPVAWSPETRAARRDGA